MMELKGEEAGLKCQLSGFSSLVSIQVLLVALELKHHFPKVVASFP